MITYISDQTKDLNIYPSLKSQYHNNIFMLYHKNHHTFLNERQLSGCLGFWATFFSTSYDFGRIIDCFIFGLSFSKLGIPSKINDCGPFSSNC